MPSKILVPFVLSLAVLAPGPAALADGDPAAGEKVYRRCKACHSISKEPTKIAGFGSNLYGVAGSKAGTVDNGYPGYSAALKKSDVIWTDENLSRYLANPRGFIPGTKMAFAGLKKEKDRADVIAYIKQMSQ